MNKAIFRDLVLQFLTLVQVMDTLAKMEMYYNALDM